MIDPQSDSLRATTNGGRVAVFVAQFFPPFNIVAAQRALRMVRVLLKEFDSVYVLTLPVDALPPDQIDETFGSEDLANPRLHILRLKPLLPGYGIVKNGMLSHRVIGATLTRLFCGPGADWMPAVAKALDTLAARAQVRLVLATGAPYMTFLNAITFARRVGAPCILDYRDLWSNNPRAPYPRLSRMLISGTLERWVNRRSRLITTVSEGCRRSLMEAGDHVVTLMNTPDEHYRAWFRGQAASATHAGFDPGRLNIVLAGTVYPECTCAILLRALAMLLTEERVRVRVHYYGSSSGLVTAEFERAGLRDNLVMHGFVAKQAAAAAVHASDALLSLVYDGERRSVSSEVLGLMTTKVFDYFLSGKPIINVSPTEADVCVLANKMGYGEFHTFAGTQHALIAQFLQSALADLESFRRRRGHADLPDFGHDFTAVLRSVGI